MAVNAFFLKGSSLPREGGPVDDTTLISTGVASMSVEGI